jgi:hypothetical protein
MNGKYYHRKIGLVEKRMITEEERKKYRCNTKRMEIRKMEEDNKKQT